MGLFPISYVFKNLPVLSYTFTFFLICSVFGTLFLPYPHPHFCKPNMQLKTFLKIRTFLSTAIFCSNAVLVAISSMQLINFFNVLPSIPTTTAINLMLLMFHILFLVPGISQFFLPHFC